MMTAEEYVSESLMAHEGKLSMNKSDHGNWYDPVRYRAKQPQRRGKGTLVGSKYGVTAYALADYLNMDCITPTTMAELERDVAIAIALKSYFRVPRIDTLEPHSRVVLAVLDMSYNAGPDRAVRLLQDAIGAGADGKIGPQTRKAYARYLEKFGEAALMIAYTDKRIAFYRSIATGGNAKFLRGWINRANSFLPGTSWWKTAGA